MTPAEQLSTVDALLAGGGGAGTGGGGAGAGAGAGAGGSRAAGFAGASAVAGAAASGRTVHTRAAAFLLRRALDDRLNAYVQARHPALARCSTRTKTAWLAQHAGSALAGRYAGTWQSLSQACHYHCSVLPPTPAELRGWRDDVAAVLRELPRSPTL